MVCYLSDWVISESSFNSVVTSRQFNVILYKNKYKINSLTSAKMKAKGKEHQEIIMFILKL